MRHLGPQPQQRGQQSLQRVALCAGGEAGTVERTRGKGWVSYVLAVTDKYQKVIVRRGSWTKQPTNLFADTIDNCMTQDLGGDQHSTGNRLSWFVP